jgi:hypothetical protein
VSVRSVVAPIVVLGLLTVGMAGNRACAQEPTSAAITTTPEKRNIFERTLEEPWRFRLMPFGWAPSEVDFHVKDGQTNEHAGLSLDDLAGALEGAVEVRGEVRKGPIGGFVSLVYLELDGDTGNRVNIDVDDQVFLWNYGLTYEVGRWNLGDTPGSPAVTVEPSVALRTLRDSISVNIAGRTKDVELDFTTPTIGVNTYWDLGKHWNFIFMGDYGGFNVDNVHETYQVTGLVGYRFDILGLPANVVAGYRKLFVDYRNDGADLEINAHGPMVGVAIDF